MSCRVGGGLSGMDTNPLVDAYIQSLPAWQHELCQRLREVVHAADPEVEETIKRRVQPYFVPRATSVRCLPRRTTSTCSSTTGPSWTTPTAW